MLMALEGRQDGVLAGPPVFAQHVTAAPITHARIASGAPAEEVAPVGGGCGWKDGGECRRHGVVVRPAMPHTETPPHIARISATYLLPAAWSKRRIFESQNDYIIARLGPPEAAGHGSLAQLARAEEGQDARRHVPRHEPHKVHAQQRPNLPQYCAQLQWLQEIWYSCQEGRTRDAIRKQLLAERCDNTGNK